LFFRQRTDLFQPLRKKMLHFAPIDVMSSRLSRLDLLEHITADLMQPAMVKLDITAIPFADRSFDVVYCSHVLEHVPADRKAMRECHRVFESQWLGGIHGAVVWHPTMEDPSVLDPKERERLFGQWDRSENTVRTSPSD
jgi:SAM-dependent methyltransferase